jgi:hypothetical protein
MADIEDSAGEPEKFQNLSWAQKKLSNRAGHTRSGDGDCAGKWMVSEGLMVTA